MSIKNKSSKLEEKAYVKCEVVRGMFSCEYFIRLKDVYGNTVWGFADKGSVKMEREPQKDESLVGLVRVHLIEEYKDKYLVQLPTEQCDRLFVPKDKLELFV